MVRTSVIGSPRTQPRCSGQALTTAVNRSASLSPRRAVSADAAHTVTDQVPLSPGMVSREMVPISATGGASVRGSLGPVK